jgi:hypothetical protein
MGPSKRSRSVLGTANAPVMGGLGRFTRENAVDLSQAGTMRTGTGTLRKQLRVDEPRPFLADSWLEVQLRAASLSLRLGSGSMDRGSLIGDLRCDFFS